MGTILRLLLTLLLLWLLLATNPPPSTFRRYLTDLDKTHLTPSTCQHGPSRTICLHIRPAFPHLTPLLRTLFAPPPPPLPLPHPASDFHFHAVDYALFTLVRPPTPFSPPFIGILGLWLPVPHPARLIRSLQFTNPLRSLRNRLANANPAAFDHDAPSFKAFRERPLPDRPWEWLIVCFTVVGALWLMFPYRAANHFTLTWQNVRHKGNWWCMILFHFSHGSSLLRLCRTVVSINYLAPLLISSRTLSLSAMYGVVLTSAATSTALGMLVLARRYVFSSRDAVTRPPIEINGGAACVYALLVAACLSPDSHLPFPGGLRPFELLMLNVLFDSFFLAGKRSIADYIAHTGAALGSWLFCSINQSSGYVS